jgi:mannose-1-phosphate guanylyltransferase
MDVFRQAAPILSRIGCSDDNDVEEVAAEERRNDVNIRVTCSDIYIKDTFNFWKRVAKRLPAVFGTYIVTSTIQSLNVHKLVGYVRDEVAHED